MLYVGLDAHWRQSTFCVLDGQGRKILSRTVQGRTARGKEVASRNATKHGLLSEAIVLPTENPKDYEELYQGIHDALVPIGELERELVRRVAAGFWRLRRLATLESAVLNQKVCQILSEKAWSRANQYREELDDVIYGNLYRVTDEKKFEAAASAARAVDALQNSDAATLGSAFVNCVKDSEVFSCIPRYERAIERSVLNALRELDRVQQRRMELAEGNKDNMHSNAIP